MNSYKPILTELIWLVISFPLPAQANLIDEEQKDFHF